MFSAEAEKQIPDILKRNPIKASAMLPLLNLAQEDGQIKYVFEKNSSIKYFTGKNSSKKYFFEKNSSKNILLERTVP